MADKVRKFCGNHFVYAKDEGKGTYTCTAHLAEGRAFNCPYDESQIIVLDESRSKNYRFKILRAAPRGNGVCRDFKILPEVRDGLISKVVAELRKS